MRVCIYKKITIASQVHKRGLLIEPCSDPIVLYLLTRFFQVRSIQDWEPENDGGVFPIVIFFKPIFNLLTPKNSKRSCTLLLYIYVNEWCKTIRSQLKYFSIKSHFLGVTMFPQLYNKVLYVPKFLVVLLRWVCDLSKIRRDSNDWVFSMVAAMIAAEISWSSLCVCAAALVGIILCTCTD